MAITRPPAPTAFSGLIIADMPAVFTNNNGKPVDAALEIQTTEGMLLLPRMTTVQRNALNAVDGSEIYNLDTRTVDIRTNGMWASVSTGVGGGNVVGPNTSIVNNIATFNNVTGTLIKDSGTPIGNIANAVTNAGGANAIAIPIFTGVGNEVQDSSVGLAVSNRSIRTGVGVAAISNATGITCFGSSSLNVGSSGINNTVYGHSNLSANTTGANNTVCGQNSLALNTTGSNCTSVGWQANTQNVTGNSITCIGANSGVNFDGLTNATAIGANSAVSISNALILGGNAGSAVSVGIGTASPQGVLDITSTTSGFLVPRMTNAQKLAIATPAAAQDGMIVYVTDAVAGGRFEFYENGVWTAFQQPIATGTPGDFLVFDGSGNISDSGLQLAITPSTGTFAIAPNAGDSSNPNNISLGFGALQAVDTGTDDIGIGVNAGSGTTSGSNSIFIGRSAGNENVDGTGITCIGYASVVSSSLTNPTVLGINASSNGDSTVAIGDTSSATGATSIAIGANSQSLNPLSIAIGSAASTTGDAAIAIGDTAVAAGPNDIAIGHSTNAGGPHAVAIGFSTNAGGSSSIALGVGTTASATNSTAVGPGAAATASEATAIGANAYATVANTLILGGTGADVVSVGIGTSTPLAVLDITSATSGILVPRTTTGAVTSPVNGMIIYDTGLNSLMFYENGAWVAPGAGNVTGPGTSIVGDIASYNNTTGTLIKDSGALLTVNSVSGAFSISATASGTATYGVSLGHSATATATNSVAVGTSATASISSVAIGDTSSATSPSGVAIGPNTIASISAVAIGNTANAGALNAIAIGVNSTASPAYTIAIGTTAVASAANAIAIGHNSSATVASTMILGGSGTDAVNVGLGTSTPAAVLDITSTTSGLLVPRTTTASVTTPVNGMIIYDTTLNSLMFRENGLWVAAGGGGGSGNVTGPGTSVVGDIASYNNTTGTLIKDSGALLTVNSVSGAFGISATASGGATYGISLGHLASGTLTNAVAIGTSATASIGAVAIGTSANGGNINSIAIGTSSAATIASSIAIGNTATSSGNAAVAIGNGASATQSHTMILGGTGVNILNVGIGTSTPAAVLDIFSTTSGLLVPRTTTGAVTTPVNGMIIYDTTANSLMFRENGLWVAAGGGGGSGNVTGPGTSVVGDIATYNNTTGTLIKDSGALLTVDSTNGDFGISTTASGTGTYNISLGNTVTSNGGNSIALGNNTLALSPNSIVIGNGAQSFASNATAIGASAVNGTPNSILLGSFGTQTQFSGGMLVLRRVKSSSYTLTPTDYILACAATSITITLPAAAVGNNGQIYIIKDETGTATLIAPITIGGGGSNIDGASTATITTAYGVVRVYSTSTQWFTW